MSAPTSRRQFLHTGLAAAALLALGRAGPAGAAGFAVAHTDAEWRALLTPEAYAVLRGRGTERAYTSPLNAEHRAGVFACAGCDRALFDSSTKFESGTGWPSFFRPLDGAVGQENDGSLGMMRTEIHCSRCGGHLGHVFDDGPAPTGLRYCMNGVAMRFHPRGVAAFEVA